MSRREWVSRRGRRVGALAVVVAIAAAWAAIVGARAAPGVGARSNVPVTVRPANGVARTHFAVRFRAAQQTGITGTTIRRYVVSATAHSLPRCSSSTSVPVPPTRRGQRVRIMLAAPAPSHAWCAGRYAGELEEIYAPVCPKGKLCPMYIAVATVGRFSFRVR